MGKFIVSVRKNDEFQFNLQAGNGQLILTSEGYSSKSACMNGVESVKKMQVMMPVMIVKRQLTVNRFLISNPRTAR